MLQTNFLGHQPIGPAVEGFKGYYHIWAWWPYKLSDLNGLNIFSFPQPMEALHEIWLQSAQWLLKRCLKLSYYESPRSKVKKLP